MSSRDGSGHRQRLRVLHVVELIHEINALEAVQVAVCLLGIDYRLLPPHLGRTDASIVLRSVRRQFSLNAAANSLTTAMMYASLSFTIVVNCLFSLTFGLLP